MPRFDLPSLLAGLVAVVFMLYSLVMEDDEILILSTGALLLIVVIQWIRKLRKRPHYFYTPEHIAPKGDWA